jgi:hypothetical protein
MSRPDPAVADGRQRAFDRLDVADAAALRDEPAARTQNGRQVPEQRVVVGDPMEGGRREDRIDVAVDAERLSEVGDDILDPAAEGGKPLACRLDHRRRPVQRDDPPTGESACQQLGHPAAPAAGIEHALVAVEWQAIEDRGAPARLRIGDTIVGPRVPVARRHVA